MNKFLQSLTKKERRAKRSAKERKFRNRLRFDHYEALYRQSMLHSKQLGVGNHCPENLTVSLTSFGERIETVYLTVESLMQQSLKADRIVLCLARDEVKESQLPATLQLQRERGLEILFCDEDLGSYKKFYYTLQKYPDDLVITVDDDMIYPVDLVDQLYRAYREQPLVIPCLRSHLMTFSEESKVIKPYKQWVWDHNMFDPSLRVFPTGVGGVLYFPGCFDRRILDAKAFKQLAPNADDAWLKCMSLLKGTACRQITNQCSYPERFIQIEGSQRVALKRSNKNKKSGNDSSIERVFSEYSAYELLT